MSEIKSGSALAYCLSDEDLMQLEEMEAEERCHEIVVEINTIRKNAMREMIFASCEIGRLLCEAKEKLPHGAWGRWLSENFDYSQSTANNLMRLHKSYGQTEQLNMFFTQEERIQIFGNLTPSQALALLPLPEPERIEFVQTHDMDQTSVRDIEKEIKARRDAEERADEAERQRNEAQSALDAMSRESRSLELEADKLRSELDSIKKEKDSKASADKKAIKEKLQKDFDKKLAAEKKALEDKLTEEQKKSGELDRRLAEAKKEAAAELEAEYAKRLLEADKRVQAAEKKAQNASNAAVQRFSVLFEQFQSTYSTMSRLLDEIKSDEPELAVKLGTALQGILEKMKGGIAT